jgi:hypothetical protein
MPLAVSVAEQCRVHLSFVEIRDYPAWLTVFLAVPISAYPGESIVRSGGWVAGSSPSLPPIIDLTRAQAVWKIP